MTVLHNYSRYVMGCRCPECLDARRRYMLERRKLGDRPSSALGVPEWMDEAACKGEPTAVFFGPDTIGTGAPPGPRWSSEQAKAICATCDHTDKCLAFALAEGIRWGVWGGRTAKERQRIENGYAA